MRMTESSLRGTAQEPMSSTVRAKDSNKNLRATWKSVFAFTLNRHLVVMIPAWLLSIIAGGIKPSLSIFMGFIFDDIAQYVAGSINYSILVKNTSKWCVVFTGLGSATCVANGGFFALWLVFGELQAKVARQRLFSGLIRREMEWYDLQEDGISPVLIRMQAQVRELQMATSQPLGFFARDIATGIVALGIALYYSWKLTLVLSISLPVAALVVWLASHRLQKAIENQKRELNEASKYANTAFNAIDTVKVFNGEDYEVRQYSNAIKKASKSYLVQAHIIALQLANTRFLVVVMFMAGFWFGLKLYMDGELTPGNIITTFYSFLMGNQAVESLLEQWLILYKGSSSGEILNQIVGELNAGDSLSRVTSSEILELCIGDIVVTNLSFSYPSNSSHPVLCDVNLFFPAGETTFLFGRSGCGKSTLTNLLIRLYEPSSGNISIDGHPIQSLDLKWLRDNVTLVQQQNVLFNETLRENIAFGRCDITQGTDEDIRVACQIAMLSEVIFDLPDGLNTVIGSGGSVLSGGQRQRVAIARARLRDSAILILDEVTNALDQVNKTLVMGAIRRWRKGKTTIIITHDSSQIYETDYVYVMDHGKVVDEGYRNTLTQNQDGPFACLSTDMGNESYLEEKLDPLSPVSEGSASQMPTGKMAISDSLHFVTDNSSADEIIREENRTKPEPKEKLRHLSAILSSSSSSNQQTYYRTKRTSFSMGTAFANAVRASADFPDRFSWPPQIQRLQATHSKLGYRRETQTQLSLPQQTDLNTNWEVQSEEKATVHQVETLQRYGTETWRTGSELNKKYIDLVSGRTLRDLIEKDKHSRHSESASLKSIFSTVWPSISSKDRIILILGFICAFIYAACTPTFSYLLAKLFNTFYETENQEEDGRKWALSLLVVAVADGASSYAFYYFLDYCGRVWVDSLRKEALARILEQPRSWFDDAANSPIILNDSLDRSAEEMRTLLGRFAGYTFAAACMILIGVAWAFIVCWKLAAVSLASVPIIYATTRAFEAVSGHMECKTDAQSSIIGEIFAETFANIRVVKALTLESHFQSKNSSAVETAYRIGLRRGVLSGIFFGITQSTTLFLITLILFYGSILVGNGSFPFSDVVACITLLLFSIANANDTIAFIPQIASARAGATRMLRLTSLPPGESAHNPRQRTVATPLPIRMRNLTFTYPSRSHHPTICNLSLTIRADTSTALVGRSGSGKSTLVSLVVGLYPVSPSTTLTFAHQPLTHLSLPALRAHMALVPQFPTLFPASLAHNILYGLSPSSPFTSPANLERAAADAGLQEFVAGLPRGFETLIGEGGRALSGGEMVRVAIARALVRRPKVLVMDEPTAGLDSEGVEAVARVVEGLGKGVAVVVVTHDVRIMRRVGWVVVVDGGRAVEQGRWEDLRTAGGPLQKLVGGKERRDFKV